MTEQLKVALDGQVLGVPFGNFPEGSLLEAAPLSADQMASGLYVARTPLDEYEPDFESVAKRDGEEFSLSDLKTVTDRGIERFSANMQAGMLYDFFYLHKQNHLDSARIVTGSQSPPTRLTLDEVALIIVLQANLTLEQASGIQAKVIHDTFHLYNRNEFLHNGLLIGDMVATPSTRDAFGMVYSYRDRSRLFDRVTQPMFANNTRRLAGLPPL